MVGSAGADSVISSYRRRNLRHRRTLVLTLGLIIVGSATAGFGAALLFGVQATFSQPLATFLAGAGALTAGALAYLNGQRTRAQTEDHHRADMDRERERHQVDTNRERERHREDARRVQEAALRDRYTAVAAQIDHTSLPAVRQAGVYALTALADDWHTYGEDEERQVCINLLQWYLRVPAPAVAGGTPPDLSEREIRQAIVQILTERRRRPPEHPRSWANTSISLRHASLRDCNLKSLDLAGLDFTRADMGGVDLTGADLTGADLTGADLTGARMRSTILTGSTLTRANLSGASLSGAKFDRARLNYSDLTGADLCCARLVDANLIEADLTRTDLNGADLSRACLYGANLSRSSLKRADLIEAELIRTDLNGAVLIDAVLTGADLTDADLTDADLTFANLTCSYRIGREFLGVDLGMITLTDPILVGIRYSSNTQWPGGFTPPP